MKPTTILPLLLAAACNSAATPTATTATASAASAPVPQAMPTPQPDPSAGDASATASPQSAIEASNAFAFDLYEQLRSEQGNLAFSPASLSIALSMTYAGAEKETASQMKEALRLPDDASALHAGWEAQLKAFDAAEDVQIEMANRLYGEQSYDFVPSFLELNEKRYGAPLVEVDFIGGSEPARQKINGWVADQTHQLIEELLPKGGVDGLTRLALINALYFKGAWASPFDKKATQQAAFTTPGGKVQVPMMAQAANVDFAQLDGAKLAQLKYEGGRFATVFVLPDAPDGLAALEKKLDAESLARWSKALSPERVDLKIPRFDLEPSKALKLKPVLQELGMVSAFDASKADFGGMAPGDDLFVDEVFHKAVVKMNEEGTEAAAATGVVMTLRSLPPKPTATFHADHPFLFFLRDLETGLVLFAGRVTNPGG